MATLKELLNQYCPNGVERKPLSEFTDKLKGMSGVSNKWTDNGNCKFIDYLNAYNNMKIDTNLLQNATVKNLNQTTIKQGDILITSASEVPEECAITSIVEDKISEGVFIDDHLFGVRIKDEFKNKVSSAYLNYYFHSHDFRKSLPKAVRGVTRFYIALPDFMELEIPIPPLPVQEKIVEILDAFTSLEAELQAELEMRKKQYNFYRDSLLDFDRFSVDCIEDSKEAIRNGSITLSDVEKYLWKLIEEYAPNGVEYDCLKNISTIDIGEFVKSDKQADNKKYPVYNGGRAYTGKYDEYNHDGKYILVSARGANAGYVNRINGKYWAGNSCYSIKTNQQKMLFNFAYYILKNSEEKLIKSQQTGSIPAVSKTQMQEFVLPVPPLEIQEAIVKILDEFNTLTTSMESGIPAHIDKVHKQYEYYRDKLLTFEELNED